ncbi:MAG: GTP cyclohydrolase II [Deltaproteobacteria bacterium]|nr:GTP cyclohydrolase II [Deltaproteobacteria bacterium]
MGNKSDIHIHPFAEVLADFRAGKPVIIVDDANRENEGDITIATEAITPELMSFMLQHARGLICVSISVEIAERLNLPLQVLNNNSPFNTPFTVSVDHRSVAQSGVTAASRALTMKKLLDPASRAEDFVSPGHVFPLIANPAGVIGRQGQTEGSYDLARIAGFQPSGVICEILQPDGTMSRGSQLNEFAERFALKTTSVEEIIKYRVREEVLIRAVAEELSVTDFGPCTTYVFQDDVDRKEHLVLAFGKEKLLENPDGALVRIHSECLTGDVFGSRRCDCGEQLHRSLRLIVERGCGLVLYLRQEGRGIGLGNKLRAYALQDQGHDTVEANLQLGFPADLRDFVVAAKILDHFKISKVRLLTNNPEKLSSLEQFGITIEERIPLIASPDQYSKSYIDTKREKLGHLL